MDDTITVRTTLRLQAGPELLLPVTTEWIYTPADPYAVRLDFIGVGRPVSWVFGRDLLADGLAAEAGEGDVRVEPADSDHTYLTLSDRLSGGVALLIAPSGELSDFLTRSYRAVPPGTEGRHLDVEECIGLLLGHEGFPLP